MQEGGSNWDESNPYKIEGLTPLTKYNYYVRCDAHDNDGKTYFVVKRKSAITQNIGPISIKTDSTCSKTKDIIIEGEANKTIVYKINNDDWEEYNQPFTIYKNMVITAGYKNDDNVK